MRTTLDIPEELMNDLLETLKLKKKAEAVKIALEDFVRRKRIEELISLSGKIKIEDLTRELEESEIAEGKDFA